MARPWALSADKPSNRQKDKQSSYIVQRCICLYFYIDAIVFGRYAHMLQFATVIVIAAVCCS